MTKEIPFVSIITITRNRAKLIHLCIESIQKQTYTNYEHIIVDGNSDDNTRNIVETYTFRDPKIKYVHMNTCGPPQQQQQGFLHSKGEYITFLDDDDEYLPNNLKKKLEVFASLGEEYGFIYGPMDYFDAQTNKYLYTHIATLEGGVEILPKAISRAYVSGTPSIMYRRTAFQDIGGTYIAGIGNEMSDWALTSRAIARGWKVKAYNKSLVKIYVNHASERMTDYTSKGKEGAKKLILFHNYFLKEYSSVIKNNPKSAVIHYLNLLSSYIRLGKYHEAKDIYKKLMATSFSIKYMVLPLYFIYKTKILRK